ncbi:PF04657 domain protein [Acinetobacter baumannii OIFC087]|nr:PF04657 domain protein [Acinetobacter baumannii OIFC087]
MIILMILLAVIGGALLSVQAAINGQLGAKVGVFRSAFLTFSVGALITALLIFYFEPKQALTLLDVIYAELSGDFPLGDSRQPIYKSLRPFDLVS